MRYIATKSIINRIFKFSLLYGKVESAISNSKWEVNFKESISTKASISAVTIDKNILEKTFNPSNSLLKFDFESYLDPNNIYAYNNYLPVRKSITNEQINYFDIKVIKEIHSMILGSDKTEFRKSKRAIPKVISENGISKEIQLEVTTLPSEINKRLEEFFEWYKNEKNIENPLILAAIVHFEIARIHPFSDGNGRLARIMEQYVLNTNSHINPELFSTEVNFLENTDRYYDLIESTIKSEDLTDWIEFYSEMILGAITNSIKDLKNISFGTIDIDNNVYINLSTNEEKVLEFLKIENPLSPVEIAKELDYTRQNVYRIIKSLAEKGILNKNGSRYKLN